MTIFYKKLITAISTSILLGFIFQSVAVGSTVFAILCIAFWIPLYIRYAKDNPQHLWFKRKLFGWGWTPVTWQGWAVIGAYIVLVSAFAFTIDESSPAREVAFTFIMPILFLTALLIRICYIKGEKPRWQWGKDISKYEDKKSK